VRLKRRFVDGIFEVNISVDGYSIASGEIGLGRGPSLYIVAIANTCLAWLLVEMFYKRHNS
jgi:hypothetical protein